MAIEHEQVPSHVATLETALTREMLELPLLHNYNSRTTEEDQKRLQTSSGGSTISDYGLLYEDRIAKAATLDLLADEYPLPKIQGPRWYNRLRYHHLSMYARLHIIVLLANFGTLIPMAAESQRKSPNFTYQDASTAFAGESTVIRSIYWSMFVVDL